MPIFKLEMQSAATSSEIRFFCSWFCPYAQRTWITLNKLGLKYDYVEALVLDGDSETDYKKHPDLLAANPKGLVPTMVMNGSEVVVESLDTIPYLARRCGVEQKMASPTQCADALWLNQNLCSPFYRILVRQDPAEQAAAWAAMKEGLQKFSEKVEEDGYYGSAEMTASDIAVFPWIFRLYILEHFRSMRLDAAVDGAWVNTITAWLDRMTLDKAVRDTCADKEKLLGAYNRYADGSAKSAVGRAVNAGKAAHEI